MIVIVIDVDRCCSYYWFDLIVFSVLHMTIHMHLSLYIYICIFILSVALYVYIYIYIYVCVYVYINICYSYLYILQYIKIYIYIYIYIIVYTLWSVYFVLPIFICLCPCHGPGLCHALAHMCGGRRCGRVGGTWASARSMAWA